MPNLVRRHDAKEGEAGDAGGTERSVHAEVERLIAAGELSPTEADERFEKLMGNLAYKRITPPEGAA